MPLEKLDAAITDRDSARLLGELHGLKGTLASVGAMELSDRAAELAPEVREPVSARFLVRLERFCQALASFAQKLRDILSKTEQESHLIMPEHHRKLNDGLARLRYALADFDYQKSLDIVSDLAKFDWSESRNRDIESIRTLVKAFDYDAALDEIDRLFPTNDVSSLSKP